MDTAQFPKYQIYVDLLTKRDHGLLLVGVLVAIGAVWLINSRFLIPRLQPLVRATIPILFYMTLAIFALGVIK